jgi:hypothetical protein
MTWCSLSETAALLLQDDGAQPSSTLELTMGSLNLLRGLTLVQVLSPDFVSPHNDGRRCDSTSTTEPCAKRAKLSSRMNRSWTVCMVGTISENVESFACQALINGADLRHSSDRGALDTEAAVPSERPVVVC